MAALFWIRNRKPTSLFPPEEDSDTETPDSCLTSFHSALLTCLRPTVTSSDTLISRPLGVPGRKSTADINKWHARLAHVNIVAITHLLKKLPTLPLLTTPPHAVCDTCIRSSLCQRTGHNIAVPRSLILFERVYSDVCGPFNIPTAFGSRYYVCFVEDSTRYPEAFTMTHRTEVTSLWSNYRSRHFCATKVRILCLRSDNGGEYKGLEKDLLSAGITWERAPPYTQHSNGVAERMVRSLNTKARAMMLASGCPTTMWGEAICTAAYIHAIIPQRNLRDDAGT